MDRRTLILSTLAMVGGAGCASATPRDPYNDGNGFSRAPNPPGTTSAQNGPPPAGSAPAETYSRDEIVNNVSDFPHLALAPSLRTTSPPGAAVTLALLRCIQSDVCR